jgi:hypothetical protein
MQQRAVMYKIGHIQIIRLPAGVIDQGLWHELYEEQGSARPRNGDRV